MAHQRQFLNAPQRRMVSQCFGPKNDLADLNKATICEVSAAAKLPFGVGMKEKDQQGLSLSTS